MKDDEWDCMPKKFYWALLKIVKESVYLIDIKGPTFMSGSFMEKFSTSNATKPNEDQTENIRTIYSTII